MNRPLLETDQIRCYAPNGDLTPCGGTGQDADGEKRGVWKPCRFQVLDSVVRDDHTGAVWTRDANPAEFPMTWNEAHQYVADMRSRAVYGRDDWDLPSRRLLFSLISHQHVNPALPEGHPFTNFFAGYYWTKESAGRLPNQAWYVHLGGGRMHKGMKHGSYMVWPVSPGKSLFPPEQGESDAFPAGRFQVDGLRVLDVRTGLSWSRNADPAGRRLTWEEALSAIHGLNSHQYGGRTDWRLPNIRELESMVDLRAHSPAIGSGHPFQNIRDAYWSSTTSVYEPRYAWTLYAQDGYVGVGFKSGVDFYAWPVAAG